MILTCVMYRLAMMELGRITGRVDVEELLDVIFRDFCIGK
jgi:tRNA modification GTPase